MGRDSANDSDARSRDVDAEGRGEGLDAGFG